MIEPLNEEMQDLDALFQHLLERSRIHLIQSVWKSLIYTQLIVSLKNSLEKKHIGAYSDSELALSNFVESNQEIFSERLSDRLANILGNLKNSSFSLDGQEDYDWLSTSEQLKESISEALHTDLINSASQNLLLFLRDQKIQRIVVLIDNLDKAWKKDNSNYEIQSEWISGLIDTSNRIVRSLSRVNRKIKYEVTFNLSIFLRSDIFYYAKENNAEPDKIEFFKLSWNTKESLFKAIDQRISYLNYGDTSNNLFWDNLAVTSIGKLDIKDFIYQRIIPRPRDLIYFLTEAKNNAVRKGHKKITESDVTDAYEEYSSWLGGFLKAESAAQLSKLGGKSDSFTNFLFSIGRTSVVKKDFIFKCAKKVFVDSYSSDIDAFLDHLVSISVLGLETSPDVFEYVYDYGKKQELQLLAERLISKRLGKEDLIASDLENQRYKTHDSLLPLLKSESPELGETTAPDTIVPANSSHTQ